MRIDLLSTLGDIFVEQTLWEQASVVYREILDCCVSRSGEAHPSSLAAQGDLAIVLFELGQSAEAIFLEAQALERANIHLGPLHSVTSILAWNIALRHEHCGDFASSSRIIADDLSWLLTIEDAGLDQDQQTIKALLSRRLSWDAASAC
ncbi:MAG: tetratricopeptide repeat protein [Acidobacteriota bacterium]